jgi:hypothetical protein
MTRRVEYIGPVVNAAARITALTHGGQIVLSHALHAKVRDAGEATLKRVVNLGKFEMSDAPAGVMLRAQGRGPGGPLLWRRHKGRRRSHHVGDAHQRIGRQPHLEPNQMSGASTASSDHGHGGGRGGRRG